MSNPVWMILFAASLGGAPAGEPAGCPFSMPGLVIEAVAPESAGFHAGLMPGDRLFSWCRIADGEADCVPRWELHTPFDWRNLETNDMQRGGVVVEGARGTERLRWSLSPASQGLTVVPLLQGTLAEACQASSHREQAGDPASAAQALERAVDLAAENDCAGEELWLRERAAQLRAKAHQSSAVDAGYEAALTKARTLGAVHVEAQLLMSWAEIFSLRGDVTQARQRLETALHLEEKNHPQRLSTVLVLLRLSGLADKQDNLEEMDRLNRRAYELARQIAPGSGAEAAAGNNLAAIAAMRGDLAQAELYLARTLAIQEKLAPSSVGIVMNLWNYGELLLERGDFAGAEASFLRAKKILEALPESMDLATTLYLLGMTADRRGDHEAAESFFRRQLALVEKLDATGTQMRERLMSLGQLALLQHQAGRAEDLWQRALSISDRLNPRGPRSASCLIGLAEAMRLEGRGAEAEKPLQQAMAIWQGINPDAPDAGFIHLKIGILLLEQGDKEAAEAHLRTAIRIREENQAVLPEAYHALARVQARRGQAEEAAASYLAAIDALDAQRSRLGGAQESQWLYGSSLGDLSFEAAEHQIALGRPQEAWKLVERGRAQGFKRLLAQRDLRFGEELPATLYAERNRLAAEYDRTQAALADWVPGQGSGEIEALQGRLRDLRLEQAEAQERIQRSSPRVGALESPPPLDLRAARAALDPGTVLLAYAVGETKSFLFVIEPESVKGTGFSFYPLPVGREKLEREIEAFRNLLGHPEGLVAAVRRRGRSLYDLLVRPAEPALARARRLLVSPDGPLHVLPFAALLAGDHYLAEAKPIHIVASAAVYGEIKASRAKKPAVAAAEMLAVGDPLYPARPQAEAAVDLQARATLRRGLRLEPLPASRREVQAISELFPHARTLLGREATEEAIRSLAPRARRLHFACHGLLDERFPLNSALALSIPEHPEEGRANGLLQAWEIFDELRLDADLVTLSACDSGLGKEMGGEGMVGLVRAFQFAGAHSVLASLWSIADDSTATLMKHFYTCLRQGKTKDAALRAAQLEMIRSRKFSHPYYWAAFQLFGDWE